jgi:plasmid stabilization system protein ParE
MPEKRRRIVWTPAARRDLRGIWQYYARVASPEIADRMLREIAETAERLTDRALMGRARDEVAPGLRSVLKAPVRHFLSPDQWQRRNRARIARATKFCCGLYERALGDVFPHRWPSCQ